MMNEKEQRKRNNKCCSSVKEAKLHGYCKRSSTSDLENDGFDSCEEFEEC